MQIEQNFLSYITNLKKERDLKIVDSHVHPLDVMGIVHPEENEERSDNDTTANFHAPGLMEKMKFGRWSNILSGMAYKYYPRTVINEIRAAYNNAYERRVLDEMEQALVDEIVLLPIEPWVSASHVYKYFNNKKFLLLGSVDVHKIKIDEIENNIKSQINDFQIKGIKLHPNLQNFKPQPSHNPEELKEKLEILYRTAEKYGLYLLFHGGATNFTEFCHIKYEKFRRSKNNALLKNFCGPDGESEVLGKYNVPVIIAHMGHYALNKVDYKLIEAIAKKYENVYFDTAGISPDLIRGALEAIGSEKIILGSDALYNRMIFGIYFIYEAARDAKTKERFDEMMINILGRNFRTKILK